ncbi:MAG: hypothetical protein ACRELS_02485 [Candidatus Rokuibacteriota bacterium]
MRATFLLTTALVLGVGIGQGTDASAQTRTVSETECQSLRQRLAEHARLSEGVRRAVAAQVAAAPAAPVAASPAPTAPAGRAEAIRARLEQIARERPTLEDQRLAALVRFEFGRATQIQGQIQTLDTEKAILERELASLPAGPTTTPAPAIPPPPSSDAARIRCQDTPAALAGAVRIRQRELGAREGQPGAIPLTGLKGQTSEQIAQELAAQFEPGASAATQVGLLDSDGNGQLDGFVDVPVPGVFRLIRQRSDGTLSVEVFPLPGGAASAYAELTRRLEENSIRQTGQTLVELLAARPAGPARALTQTGEFAQARERFMAGNVADAGRIDGPAAGTVELQNFRGESVRVMEIISPVAGGLSLRRVVVLPRAGDQELWEETTTIVRPVSYWRTDVEVVRSRETRTAAGALVGQRSILAPVRFTLER